jgi:hypothetical protein
VDAVGGRLGARLYPVQEDYLAAHVLDARLVVAAAGEQVFQARELVVVGGEEGEGLDVVVQNSAIAQARLIPS